MTAEEAQPGSGLPDIRGKICVRVIKVRHHYRGQPDGSRGPLQFEWDGGGVITVDSRTDLTVAVSDQPWQDPYAAVAGAKREALEESIGLWERRPVLIDDPLHGVIGRAAGGLQPMLDPLGLEAA